MGWYGDELQEHHLIPEDYETEMVEEIKEHLPMNATIRIIADKHRLMHRMIVNTIAEDEEYREMRKEVDAIERRKEILKRRMIRKILIAQFSVLDPEEKELFYKRIRYRSEDGDLNPVYEKEAEALVTQFDLYPVCLKDVKNWFPSWLISCERKLFRKIYYPD
jgi:hypothetical protein